MKSIRYRSAVLSLLTATLSCRPGEVTQASRSHDPTAVRTPKPTKSLALQPDWTPPAPTRSRQTEAPTRVQPSHRYGVATPEVGWLPSDAELRSLPLFSEPLIPVPGESSIGETRALAAAVSAYQDQGTPEITDALDLFISEHPTSRWVPALLVNLGAVAFDTGYFGIALDRWQSAWDLAKAGNDVVSRRLANKAFAEYAKMTSRVGRLEDLQRMFGEGRDRVFMGDARVKIQGALEAQWTMAHKPGVAFRCGPSAVANVASVLNPEAKARVPEFMRNIESPRQGFSLNEVQAMSAQLGIDLQMAKRDVGAAIIVPSVVHWKVNHYGALARERDGKYWLEDPTFGKNVWMSARAVDHEASGYFLVPAGPLPRGWRSATIEEANGIFGRGYTGDICTNCNDDDGPCSGSGPPPAMAVYTFERLVAGLRVSDTPVNYQPAVGPDVFVTMAYSQREANQPTSNEFTSFSPQWVSNWISYIVDDPGNPGSDVELRVRNGSGA